MSDAVLPAPSRSWRVGRCLGVLLLASAALAAHAEPQLTVFVRHAERAAEAGEDPPLSEAGQRRAQLLAETLAAAGVGHIVTTQWRRTRETAAPLARRLDIRPQVVATRRGEAKAHIAEVAAAVRRVEGAVLVVGHSNTVTEIIAALGGPSLPPICDASYDQIFVLQPGTPVRVLSLRYGEATAPGDCP